MAAKTADIVPKSQILKLQIKRVAGTSGIQKKLFTSKEDAEAWLDSISG